VAWGLDWDDSGNIKFTTKKIQKTFSKLFQKSKKSTPEELILKELGTVHSAVCKEAMFFRNPAIEDVDKSKSFMVICLLVCLYVVLSRFCLPPVFYLVS
jgi:hypothetical protein